MKRVFTPFLTVSFATNLQDLTQFVTSQSTNKKDTAFVNFCVAYNNIIIIIIIIIIHNKRQIAPSNDCNFKEFTVTAEYLA